MFSVAAKKLLDGSMLRFALVGCANTLFGFAVILMVGWLLQLGDVAANAVGYGCGLLLSFVLNRQYTFRYEGRTAGALVRYLLAFAVSYGVNVGVLVIFTAMLGQSSVLSQAAAVCSYAIAFYALSRWVVFA
jgi:putative flippase GtrA